MTDDENIKVALALPQQEFGEFIGAISEITVEAVQGAGGVLSSLTFRCEGQVLVIEALLASAEIIEAMEQPQRDDSPGAAQIAAYLQALTAPASPVAATLYTLALALLLDGRHEKTAKIGGFLLAAGHPDPRVFGLTGYAAFLRKDKANARKLLSRAAYVSRNDARFAGLRRIAHSCLLRLSFGADAEAKSRRVAR